MRITAVAAVALVACAHTASESDQAGARIHHDIAVQNLNRGELRAALRDLLSAVELDPAQPQAHNALGLVYHAMGRGEDALEHYQKAVELKPTYSEALNNMGVLLMDVGRYDEAIAAFKVALGDILYPTPSLAEGNMGWAHYKKGDVDAGLKYLRNAVATNPKFCRGYEWLARIGLDTERPNDVVANCKRFEKYCANDDAIAKSVPADYLRRMRYYLALGYLQQGEREAARSTLAACAVDPAAMEDDAEFGGKCSQSLRSMQ